MLLRHSARSCKISPKMDDPSHSVLHSSTSTLSQNEEDILLKWGRDVFEVIHDFSFLEHPWPLGMKFLSFSELILGPLHLKILQPY